jgi:hypothetical protein
VIVTVALCPKFRDITGPLVRAPALNVELLIVTATVGGLFTTVNVVLADFESK